MQSQVLALTNDLGTERRERPLVFKGAAGPLPGYSSQPHSASGRGAAAGACAYPGCVGTGRAMTSLHQQDFFFFFFNGSGFYFSSCPQVPFPVVLVCAVPW